MKFAVRIGVKFGVLVTAAAMACAAAPAGDSLGTPIARGVRVGDVVLTGLTVQPAEEQLRAALAQPIVFRVRGQRVVVPAARFRKGAAVDSAVSAALRAEPGAAIPLRVRPDRAAIDRTLARLAQRFYVAPRDASVTGLDASLTPVLGPAAPGRKLNQAAARRAILAALAMGDRTIRLGFIHVPPSVTPDELGSVIVIRRSSNTLTLFNGTQVVRTFGVATGQAIYPTPLGRFDIVDMQYNPWWYPPTTSSWAKGLKPVPPGPGNPLGTRWMGLSAGGVGIHGTPDSASIGYSASHGCIRMLVPDAEWLFDHVSIGTPVFIVSA
jgi:lipoprotein-anchoring transpeptidase ErfK/SrfK